MRRLLLNLLCLACCLLPAAPALAQTTPLIIDQNRPDRAPPSAVPTPAPQVARGRVENRDGQVRPFVLKAVRVQGSTAPAALIEPAWRPYVGGTADAATVNRIADAVGAAYARSDVALYTVLVPRQTYADGVLRLIVVEGYVSEVEVRSKDPEADLSRARAYAARLRAERPLRRSTLERSLALIRDIPGLKLEVQALQDKAPGAVRMVLGVTRQRLQAGVGLNTRGTQVLGRTQVQADLMLNGLADDGDQARLTVSAPSDLRRFLFVQGAYMHPVGHDGTTVQASVGRLRTRPKIAGLPIKGEATVAGLQASRPVIRGVRRNLYLTASLDGLNSSNAVFGYIFSDERVRTLRAAGALSLAGAKSSFALSATISQGMDGLGARGTTGAPDFTKLNGQASYAKVMAASWILRLAAGGQYGGGRLPASEQFALGGPQFGRAFQSAIVVGDRGYAGSAELAWRPAKGLPKPIQGSEAYVFADAGKVSVLSRGAVPARSFDLASAGGGFRLAMVQRAALEVEGAKGLDRPAPGIGKAWRLMLTVRSVF